MDPSPYGTARSSAARDLIARCAAAIGAAFTVDDLVAAVRDCRPETGVATIYRAVGAMEDSGYLERVGERDGTALFTHCGSHPGHHHHAVCTGCGATVVTACPVDDAVETARRAGFTVTGHELRIYGLCRTCSEDPARAGKAG